MYKLIKEPVGETILNAVLRVADNANIPFDPANTDYQTYLKWVAEGNEPLPADDNGQTA
jgi:hypothetical protein